MSKIFSNLIVLFAATLIVVTDSSWLNMWPKAVWHIVINTHPSVLWDFCLPRKLLPSTVIAVCVLVWEQWLVVYVVESCLSLWAMALKLVSVAASWLMASSAPLACSTALDTIMVSHLLSIYVNISEVFALSFDKRLILLYACVKLLLSFSVVHLIAIFRPLDN